MCIGGDFLIVWIKSCFIWSSYSYVLPIKLYLCDSFVTVGLWNQISKEIKNLGENMEQIIVMFNCLGFVVRIVVCWLEEKTALLTYP